MILTVGEGGGELDGGPGKTTPVWRVLEGRELRKKGIEAG